MGMNMSGDEGGETRLGDGQDRDTGHRRRMTS